MAEQVLSKLGNSGRRRQGVACLCAEPSPSLAAKGWWSRQRHRRKVRCQPGDGHEFDVGAHRALARAGRLWAAIDAELRLRRWQWSVRTRLGPLHSCHSTQDREGPAHLPLRGRGRYVSAGRAEDLVPKLTVASASGEPERVSQDDVRWASKHYRVFHIDRAPRASSRASSAGLSAATLPTRSGAPSVATTSPPSMAVTRTAAFSIPRTPVASSSGCSA